MGKLQFENDKFLYTDGDSCEVLLDCRNFTGNKSKIPMHSFEPDALTIPNLIVKCLNQHEALCNGEEEVYNGHENLILNLLLIRELIKTQFPLKVLELGCTSGIVSCYLATILGIFDGNNTLCCVSDALGNASGNQWLDRISLVKYPPRLTMEAADYDDTMLEPESFDLVLINGSVRFEEPYRVVQEAERLAKQEGRIVCYACNSPLLENSFRLRFSERNEYTLKPDVCILTAKKNSRQELEDEPDRDGSRAADAFFAELLRDLSLPLEAETIRLRIQQCEQLLSEKVYQEDTSLKIRLIDIKEQLIQYLLEGEASALENVRGLMDNRH